MIRDPFYREIIDRLRGRLDEDAFEACACDLLRREFPTLVSIPGGSDGGMDGIAADPGPFLVSTTSPDVIGNLTRSLKSFLKNGGSRRTAIVATSQELTKRRRDNLEKRARELGFRLVQIYSQAAMADRLYYEPRWYKDLLGLTGRPSALTVIPKTHRPLLDDTLVGRETDLAWLRQSRGDRLLVGAPGSGKTFLLRSFALDGSGLFLVDSDKNAIADALRSQKPDAIIVDDAHLDLDVLSVLRQLRDELGAEFDILATSWAGDKEKVAVALNLAESHISELDLLTRDAIVEVIKNAGLAGPHELIREIVNQSEGRPGLAVTLTMLCRTGGAREVVFGEALGRELTVAFERLVGRMARDILAIFSLSGNSGLSIDAVSEFSGVPLVELRSVLARLAAGGVVREAGHGRLSVRPETLRYILIRDTFFTPPATLDIRTLIEKVPDQSETASTLIGAKARGGKIPWLIEFLEQIDSPSAWRDFASMGKGEASFVLRRDPSLITTVAREALRVAPDEAIPLLLEVSVGDNRPLHNSPDHALRLIQDWIVGTRPGTDAALDDRTSLLRATSKWLENGGDEKIATRALVIAGSPKFEGISSDPGSGRTVTIYRGLLTYPDIERLRMIWRSITELIGRINCPDWIAVFNAVHEWAYPYVHSHTSPGDSAPLFHSITAEILRDLSEISREHPGVQQRLREYAERLGIDLDTTLDPDFEILFPSEDFENWQAAAEKQARQATALAVEWRDLSRQQVAQRLHYLELEAALIGKTHPRLTWVLCEALSEGSTDCVDWVNEFVDHGLLPDDVFPFLNRAILSEEQGWEEISFRCLNTQAYAGVAISALITRSSIPDVLLVEVEEKIAAFDQLVRVRSLRREIPEQTLRILLRNKSARVATAAALGEWNAGSPGFRDSLVEDCRQALLRAEGEDYCLREIFKHDATFAHDWLITRIEAEKNSVPYHNSETIQGAIEALSFDEKLSVLDRLSLDPEAVDWELLKELIGSDPRLYENLLGRSEMSRFHLLPLAGPPTGTWCDIAVMALDASYSPDDVAEASFPWVWSWEGNESDMWKNCAREFEAPLTHRDPRLHTVARAAIELAKARQIGAEAEERREKVFGSR